MGGEFVVSMLRRRGLRANAGSPTPILPSEYQQVEWIRSSGTQYIDTGAVINSDSGMEVEAEWDYTNNTALMGAAIESNTRDYGFGTWNNYLIFQYNGTLGATFVANRTVYAAQNGKFYLDGELKREKKATFSIGRSAFVFWANFYSYGGWGISKAKAKVYYAKVMNSVGEAIWHGVPCYRKSDGEIGMYDTVSQTFFTNAGTGTFTKGADVN